MSNEEIKAVSEIQFWDIDKIIPYEKNAKIHDEENVKKIAAAIKSRGFNQPITIDENGVIIAGHGRRLAAISLGMKKIPVMVAKGWSEEMKAAERISDNLVARGEIDDAMLSEELMALSNFDIDFETLGLTDDELNSLSDDIIGQEMDDIYLNDEHEDDKSKISEVERHAHEQRKLKEHDYKEIYSVIVECDGEDMQREVYEKMLEEGYTCKIQTI